MVHCGASQAVSVRRILETCIAQAQPSFGAPIGCCIQDDFPDSVRLRSLTHHHTEHHHTEPRSCCRGISRSRASRRMPRRGAGARADRDGPPAGVADTSKCSVQRREVRRRQGLRIGAARRARRSADRSSRCGSRPSCCYCHRDYGRWAGAARQVDRRAVC